MARRLATIAKEINERIEGLTAEVVPGYTGIEHMPSGVRIRHPVRGKWGNRIIVRNSRGDVVLDHNGAEFYKRNGEVDFWLKKWKSRCSS